MNANQIINMVVRLVMRRVLSTGVNAGINAVGNKMNRRKQGQTDRAEARQEQPGLELLSWPAGPHPPRRPPNAPSRQCAQVGGSTSSDLRQGRKCLDSLRPWP